MRRSYFRLPILLVALVLCLSFGGIYAQWLYPASPLPQESSFNTSINTFKYGLIYITSITLTDGDYDSAVLSKTGETSINADVTLNNSEQSSVTAEIIFYNSTNVSYYYDELVTLNTDNNDIAPVVSGIAQKDEIPSKTYKTATVTFQCENRAALGVHGDYNFKFTVDKDSIGDVVAITAVEKFSEILNVPDQYATLTDAMDNRGGINKASSVTYIGNVAGADSGDSADINGLFGDEFMKMDLDGDGTDEPITMMIKRENLDGDPTTGDLYSYTTWREEITVNGVEMTIYITANSFDGVRNGDTMDVYAATFTKLSGSTEWIEVIPLTKGTATVNNYNNGSWGTPNSFNTDTWRNVDGVDMEALVNFEMNK